MCMSMSTPFTAARATNTLAEEALFAVMVSGPSVEETGLMVAFGNTGDLDGHTDTHARAHTHTQPRTNTPDNNVSTTFHMVTIDVRGTTFTNGDLLLAQHSRAHTRVVS